MNDYMNDINRKTRSLDRLIAKVVSSVDKNLTDVRYELLSPDDSFFMSSMFFVKITGTSNTEGSAKTKTMSIVVKQPPRSPAVREMMLSDAQFHNEILFYKRYIGDSEDLPRFIYAEENPPMDTVLVLENICQWGFGLCQWKYNAPLEYTLAAFREIARFHAKGYTMKERRRDDFFKFVGNLWETRYEKNTENNMKVVIESTSVRGVEYLRDQGHDEKFCDKLEAHLSKAYNSVVLKSIEAEEPLATLCHGDFTLNNTFFKRESGELRAMFIDFALTRYGSPTIDLSTYLCLHCAEDLDKELLDDVLKVYHDSLEQCMLENGIMDCDKYSYEALVEDFKKKGLLGFIVASFFLPMLMGKCDQTPEEMAETDMEEWAKTLHDLGGDEISAILGRMLLKLHEFGCFDHVM